MTGRVAVLGASGCVGRQVCAAFARQGRPLVAVARRRAAHLGAYRFLPLDVAALSGGELAKVLAGEGVEAVVNATGGWVAGDEEMHRTYVRLVDQLIEAMMMLPGPARLVHVGSVHEYGPTPHGLIITEELRPAPQSVYARTKLAGSRRILDAVRAGELDAVVLRVANVYGPHPAEASFLGGLVGKLRDGAELDLTIVDAWRDFVDVRDVADLVVKVTADRAADPLINVGSGQAINIRTLVEDLLAAAGRSPESVRERAGAVQARGGDWTQVDIAHATRLLGWRPRRTHLESVRAMWEAAGAPAGVLPSHSNA
ncbi:NAD-dependent epimerase/dehydratase family protein [Spongiactinospora sp. 9N601]|uniref:NAD-dependent epimerase/dehydratase family protein n=1 Tax=Spongiactinospora sp. 9N601 TaxID=3375149 RepID=UPI0037A353A4